MNIFETSRQVTVLGAGMVRTMVEALEVGGFDAVVARQVPWPTASAVTRARLRAWTPPGREVVASAMLDNVCALYRREALLADPFDAGVGADSNQQVFRFGVPAERRDHVPRGLERDADGNDFDVRDLHGSFLSS